MGIAVFAHFNRMNLTEVIKPNTWHTSPKGRKFRTFGVSKVEGSKKYINRAEKYEWDVHIKFKDNDQLATIRFNHLDQFVGVRKYEAP